MKMKNEKDEKEAGELIEGKVSILVESAFRGLDFIGQDQSQGKGGDGKNEVMVG